MKTTIIAILAIASAYGLTLLFNKIRSDQRLSIVVSSIKSEHEEARRGTPPRTEGFTLAPGQSATISTTLSSLANGEWIAPPARIIPAEANIQTSNASALQFVPVAPPKKPVVDSIAGRLGLPKGLRAEVSDDEFRCCSSGKMQPAGSIIVWVPDGISTLNSAAEVTEAARMMGYNGNWSGWSLSEALKLR